MKNLFYVSFRIIVCALVVALLSGTGAFFVEAQLTPQQEQAQLEEELAELEKEIQRIERDITSTRQERETLQSRVSILRSRIQQLTLQIQQSNRFIQDLRGQITDTSQSIGQTLENVEKTKEQLGELLQRIYQEDQRSSVEIVLAGSTLSDFFSHLAALEAVNARSSDLLGELKGLSTYLESQRGKLESEKTQEEQVVRVRILQQQESTNMQQQTQNLLKTTQERESEYQRLLADKRAQAQEIRSRIFVLVGVSDTEAPSFGEAVEIARWAGVATGVRPALVLAILTQESNIGRNVGQCYLTDPETARGVVIRTGQPVSNVMKPMGAPGRKGDIDDFMRITKQLGLDPFKTPISCPIPSVGGYGGAMGPAQFIPTTWAMYEARLEGILGRPANPWNIRDSFLASAVLLADLGAGRQTTNAEWCAALAYFSGTCKHSASRLASIRFYGDNVLALAARIEKDIKTMEEGLLGANR
ncbi:MAG: hypothetical protein Q8P71_02670 [bacterium]|nr:hypothetical protein [bacterium]